MMYGFKEGEKCTLCGDGIVSKQLVQTRMAPSLNCCTCRGSGVILFSGADDFWVDCDCLRPVGKKVPMLHCPVCGNIDYDEDRKKSAERIRVHLRKLWERKDTVLLERLASTFAEGMSFDNYGEWHIDHIKPVSAFLDEGVDAPTLVNSVDNLQALWAVDNLRKGAKY